MNNLNQGTDSFIMTADIEPNRSTQQAVMKRAWRRAKYAAKKFGGKASEYVSFTMKSAWKTERRLSNSYKVGKFKTPTGAPKSEASVQLDILEKTFKDAQRWGDEHDTLGAAMEGSNGSNFLEFIEDLRESVGDEALVKHIKEKGYDLYRLTMWAEELVQAHYDDRYAVWAGGTENYKAALRAFAKVMADDAEDDLLAMFNFK